MISEKSDITRCTFLQDARVVPKVSTRRTKKLCTGISNFVLKLTSCELVVFIDMKSYILTEGRASEWSGEEVCLGGLGVGGNYKRCLVIVIFMGFGGAKR